MKIDMENVNNSFNELVERGLYTITRGNFNNYIIKCNCENGYPKYQDIQVCYDKYVVKENIDGKECLLFLYKVDDDIELTKVFVDRKNYKADRYLKKYLGASQASKWIIESGLLK